MSAIGAALGKFIGAVGGPQVTAIVLVGGVAVGATVGGFAASNSSATQGTTGSELPIYPCPDQGPELAKAPSGQKMLVTGRTADGAWLRIYFPAPGRIEGWVQASALSLAAAADSLPVATCQVEVAASGIIGPGSTLTAIANNSPSPSPTPVPTATPLPNSAPIAGGAEGFDRQDQLRPGLLLPDGGQEGHVHHHGK